MNPSWARRLFIVGVMAAHVALLFNSSRLHFATIDETGHIPAGLHHWQHGTFELYRVNPPLPRMIATLPVWMAGANTDLGPLPDAPGRRLEWTANNRFAENNKDRYVELVRLARLAGIVWSLLGAWVVMRWSSELFGRRAGLLALVLWCFGPNVLAYAQLVTPDIPSTVAGIAACYVFRNYLRNPGWGNAWFAGLLFGVALLTRSTWLILFGLWPVMAVLYLWQGSVVGQTFLSAGRQECLPHIGLAAISRPKRLSLRLAQVAAIFVAGIAVLNLGYGFQGTGRPLGDFVFVSKTFAGERSEGQRSGNRFQGSETERMPIPLPADYVLGIDLQRADFEANWPFYINGEWRKGGSWYFYLYALLLKIPLGCWGLFLIAVALMVVGRSVVSWREEMLLWLPALAILAVVSSQTGLNYFRYILPLLPFVLIGSSRCAMLVDRQTWQRGVVVGSLAVGVVASSLAVYPHSHAYFNEAVGGPQQAHRYLVDSNFDWGQDLLYLKQWLDEHPEHEKIGLAYFNFVDPRIAGIDFELPPLNGAARTGTQRIGPYPGVYAVSVHFVQGGMFSAPDGKGSRRLVPLNGYAYFQHFQPIAKAGHTIWIYDLSRAEVNEVRQRLGLPELAD